MSRDLFVAAVAIERLRALQGRRDHALLASVIERHRERLARHDDYFRRFPRTGAYLSLAEAIAQILDGRVDPAASPRFQFEHAAGLLAETLGEPLETDAFMESAPLLWDEVDTVICRKLRTAGCHQGAWPTLAEVLKRGPCLEIPLDPVWPLASGHLCADEVRAAANAAKETDLESEDDLADLRWPDDALQGAVQYRSWLRHAADRQLGLYFHA